MRVIAGTLKGRKLKRGQSKRTRPTSDKVKEAIFHKMGPYFSGGSCLDLFAGSGALGIEALSRGIDEAIFVDRSKEAIRTIHENIKYLKIHDRCKIYRNDALRALRTLIRKQHRFDLILIDPPYETSLYSRVIKEVVNSNLLAPDGYLYIEHNKKKSDVFSFDPLHIVYERKHSATIRTMILQNKQI